MQSLPLSFSLSAALVMMTLAGCAVLPSSTVLSRLPDGQPCAVTAKAQPLTAAEKQRYDAIDRQVLCEQNKIMSFEASARAYSYYASPPVSVYGGYYGGWGSGVSYLYPGWGW
ncbi:MAG: hypothetical protein V3Q69_04505 [Burkholderia sp.]|nr:MAG: hypothetical protein E5299_02560 [Burkholderia gladioli]